VLPFGNPFRFAVGGKQPLIVVDHEEVTVARPQGQVQASRALCGVSLAEGQPYLFAQSLCVGGRLRERRLHAGHDGLLQILHDEARQNGRTQKGHQGRNQKQLRHEQRHDGHQRVAQRQLPAQPS
jgi:hypothetical protein